MLAELFKTLKIATAVQAFVLHARSLGVLRLVLDAWRCAWLAVPGSLLMLAEDNGCKRAGKWWRSAVRHMHLECRHAYKGGPAAWTLICWNCIAQLTRRPVHVGPFLVPLAGIAVEEDAVTAELDVGSRHPAGQTVVDTNGLAPTYHMLPGKLLIFCAELYHLTNYVPATTGCASMRSR